jgi:hypothetical protein
LLSARDFETIVEVVKQTKIKEMVEDRTEIVQKALKWPKGKGILSTLRAASGQPIKTMKEFAGPEVKPYLEAVKQSMIKQQGADSGAQNFQRLLQQIQSNPDQSVGAFFSGADSGKGGTNFAVAPGSFGENVQKIMYKQVERTISKKVPDIVSSTVKVPAETLFNKFVNLVTGTAAAATLAGLGIGLVGAAAGSAALRAKGKRSSRLNSLENLFKSLKNVGGSSDAEEDLPNPEDVPEEQVANTEELPEEDRPVEVPEEEQDPKEQFTKGKYVTWKTNAGDLEFGRVIGPSPYQEDDIMVEPFVGSSAMHENRKVAVNFKTKEMKLSSKEEAIQLKINTGVRKGALLKYRSKGGNKFVLATSNVSKDGRIQVKFQDQEKPAKVSVLQVIPSNSKEGRKLFGLKESQKLRSKIKTKSTIVEAKQKARLKRLIGIL